MTLTPPRVLVFPAVSIYGQLLQQGSINHVGSQHYETHLIGAWFKTFCVHPSSGLYRNKSYFSTGKLPPDSADVFRSFFKARRDDSSAGSSKRGFSGDSGNLENGSCFRKVLYVDILDLFFVHFLLEIKSIRIDLIKSKIFGTLNFLLRVLYRLYSTELLYLQCLGAKHIDFGMRSFTYDNM